MSGRNSTSFDAFVAAECLFIGLLSLVFGVAVLGGWLFGGKPTEALFGALGLLACGGALCYWALGVLLS